MRKIERQMNRAILTRTPFNSSNTSVIIDDNSDARVYLHGNHIATVTTNEVQLFDGGYQSNTTKSRLNAILEGVDYGSRVFQKQWNWYFQSNTQPAIDFTSGMIV
tara:strand:- start:297 stop:611 length:315 start_codon:yes stop_codon:yes gene_type:complete